MRLPLPPLLSLTLALSLAATTTAFAATSVEPQSDAAAKAAIAESTSAILQGDSHRAIAALEQASAAGFVGADASYRDCMIERFQRATPAFDTEAVSEPFVRDVFRIYQEYWWHALDNPSQRASLETTLFGQLRQRLDAGTRTATDMDALEPLLQSALLERGYYAQLGRTMPLRELMLWRKQETRYYDVDLPEGRRRARVELLDDFVSRGWSAYARCGRGSAGGWATADMLYAVVPSYTEGLDSEAFRVVFLGHETQHFADQNTFPGMASWELEYRAKLVELAQAREVSAKRLGYMITAQSEDIDSPHTYANKRVVADLTARLGRAPDQVSIDELQQAARAQLLADTQRRKPGAHTATTAP
ncbi:hypothetical protein J2X06_002668 [Lysobacter niastensis]|uniref:Uncharacterized protein n=1 Tax=Lysobacter niastensis TaxID=380629 RepID=A0ABU1WDI5_9GAMM|nr:hypothetical protein [Lysobacter niastensis]MDR7135459.1 hypothetical protein [Lysobacter niastensis]